MSRKLFENQRVLDSINIENSCYFENIRLVCAWICINWRMCESHSLIDDESELIFELRRKLFESFSIFVCSCLTHTSSIATIKIRKNHVLLRFLFFTICIFLIFSRYIIHKVISLLVMSSQIFYFFYEMYHIKMHDEYDELAIRNNQQ